MSRIKQLLLVISTFILISFTMKNIEVILWPSHFPAVEYSFEENKLSSEKLELGRALFYDPLLSADQTISCASCHSPYNAFAHTDHDLSHGIRDQIGTRNAPPLFNLAWHKDFMWDGAIHHLDLQALAPIEDHIEMAMPFDSLVGILQGSSLYTELFQKAYGDSLVTGERFLKAMAQFQLSLVSAAAKYDRVLIGQEKFTDQESAGYELFKNHCSSCHSEPLFTSGVYANNGLAVDESLNDVGRMKVTQLSSDSLSFKIPSLRNLEFTYPYMHDGRFRYLSEVINHYTEELKGNEYVDARLKGGILLNEKEKVDLLAFLLTLSDRDFVFNPKHQFPREILLNQRK